MVSVKFVPFVTPDKESLLVFVLQLDEDIFEAALRIDVNFRETLTEGSENVFIH